ncbi:MAG: hypothetical protein WA930_06760 [Rhodanobacter sp.]
MTTEAQSRQFEFKQAIIELLWNDDTPQAATQVVARCTSDEEREHALWMAVALQRAAAVTALLHAQAREAALSLLCGGLARAGAPKADTHVAEWGAWSVNTIDIPVKVGTSPFWFEAEKLMDIYLEQGRIKGDWLVMLPALREGVAPGSLERFIQTLNQAGSREIHIATALLRAEIDRQALQGGMGEPQPVQG